MTSIIKTRYVDSRFPQVQPNHVRTSIKAAAVAVALPLFLTGCEAPLNLEGVNQELQKQVRRTDQFQGVVANDTTLVVVGADGVVLTSPSSNLNWQRQQIAGNPALVDVAVCPDQSFIALSMDKQVWRSQDNGASWQASALPTSEDLLDLTCAPDNSLWAVGSFSTILSSRDGGANWEESSLGEDAMLTGIQFLDADTALVSGEFGVVSRSDDGGASWNPPEYIPNDFYTQAAYFTSVEQGWAGGLSGQIMYTEDGGLSWEQQPTPTESPIYGFATAGEQLLAFGDHATVLAYQNGQWTKLESGGKPVYLRGATALNSDELLLTGGAGSLFTLSLQSNGSHVTQK